MRALMFLLLGTLTTAGGSTCPPDVEQQMTRCVRQGDKLVKQYMRHLRSRRRTKSFRLCRKFADVQECFDDVLSLCSVDLDPDWRHVYDHLTCVCNEDSATACCEMHSCFEEEYWGPPSDYCEEIKSSYKVLNKQEICLSIPERTRCHASHVALTCGKSAGEFAYHVTRVFLKRHLHRYSCSPVLPKPDLDFLPSANCSPTFLETLEGCETTHIPQLIQFYKYNALVATGNITQVKLGCRQYRAYKGCVRSVKRTCKAGFRFVLAYDPHLRTYLDKMEFICRQAAAEYASHLSCYQRLVRQSTMFNQCRPYLESWKPALESVTSFQYYCQPNSFKSQNARRGLDKLRGCYHNVMSNSCGIVGGVIFDRFLQRAFQDPLYLKFAYKPTCAKISSQTTPPGVEKPKWQLQEAYGYSSPTSVRVNVTIEIGPKGGTRRTTNYHKPAVAQSKSGQAQNHQTSGIHFVMLLVLVYSGIT